MKNIELVKKEFKNVNEKKIKEEIKRLNKEIEGYKYYKDVIESKTTEIIYGNIDIHIAVKFDFAEQQYKYSYRVSEYKTQYCYGYSNNGNVCISHKDELFNLPLVYKNTEKLNKEEVNFATIIDENVINIIHFLHMNSCRN